jgi:ATP/maltotriose-dependent transcriptional regulator MalT
MVESGRLGRAGSRRFVGRVAELTAIRSCVADVRAGRPRVVLIEGGSGIGKTALIGAVQEELYGFNVLRAHCAREETDLDFGMVEQLAALLPDKLASRVRTVIGSQAGEASPIFVGNELLSVLSEVGASGPIVLVVEDLQWSDRLSAQALGFVMRRLYADQVLALLSAHTEEPVFVLPAVGPDGPDRPETALEATPGWSWLSAREFVLRMRLGGLETEDVRELAALGGVPLTFAAANRLRAHTGGNPLYLTTLLADANAESLSQPGPLPVPASFAAALHEQLAALPPDARALLDAVTVLDARTPLSVVATLAGVQDASVALEPLLSAGLVQWNPSDPVAPVEVPHPLQRDAVYAAISPSDRRELHAAAATLVARPASWAHRVAASERADPVLAQELAREAKLLYAQGSYERAANFLLWASDLNAEVVDRERYLLEAVSWLFIGQRTARLASLRPQVEACSPSPARSLVLGNYAMLAGQFDAAGRLLREALATVSQPGASPADAALAGRVCMFLSAALAWTGTNLQESVRLARMALDLAVDDPQITIRAIRAASYAVLLMDGPMAALNELADLSGLRGDRAEIRPNDAHLLVIRGAYHVLDGALHTASRDISLALKLASDGQVVQVHLEAHYWFSMVQHLTGAWDDAAMHAEKALAIATTDEIPWGLTQSAWMVAHVAAGQGRWAAAEAASAASWEAHNRQGPPLWAVLPRMASAAYAQARQDYDAIVTILEPMAAAPDLSFNRLHSAYWLPIYIEGLIGSGDLARAEPAVAELGKLADRVRYLRPAHAWLSGWLAEASGEPEVADHRYATGLAIPPSADDAPFFRARLEHAYGKLLAVMGSRKTASELLRSAHERFTAMGARPYLGRCAEDLSHLQVPRPRTSNALLDLTDRERDVARLVGEGRTNAETAAQLYLSHKTVEYHLANIYLKLGITSRRQLRDQLSGSTSVDV